MIYKTLHSSQTKDWTPPKTMGELRCSRRISSSCSSKLIIGIQVSSLDYLVNTIFYNADFFFFWEIQEEKNLSEL